MTNIIAVVVTYNRKELLKNCLQKIFFQNVPLQKVIVIDNASTDGTETQVKDSDFFKSGRILYFKLPSNFGGAGGFHEGIKIASTLKPDWIWLMDDDGEPRPDTLSNLLNMPERFLFRGPLIIDILDNQHNRLSFPIPIIQKNKKRDLLTIIDAKDNSPFGYIEGYLNPFNGVLLNRKVIDLVGLPCPDFFLWGDETEYFLRIKKKGIPIATSTSALFFHPSDKMNKRKFSVLKKNIIVNFSNDNFRSYLLIRNSTFISKKYFGIKGLFNQTIKSLFFYKIASPQTPTSIIFKAYFHGLTGNLRKHLNYKT
ncbi:glycosyltransferase [Deltaproteobacteria bacterium PRO3]|nr:glycosyltransferase [Deltaproteobacteria bacterium PRO3]